MENNRSNEVNQVADTANLLEIGVLPTPRTYQFQPLFQSPEKSNSEIIGRNLGTMIPDFSFLYTERTGTDSNGIESAPIFSIHQFG